MKVELALTPQARSRGLMFRSSLACGRGMLFIFAQDDFWGFWMKNTPVPLDIIWIDKNKRVVDIVEKARPIAVQKPPIFTPVRPARYVLETNAGFVREHKIKRGDTAKFKWIFSTAKI